MDSKKRVTIKDVARETGFSIATVSRVINGTNMYYSPETQEKIEDAVKKLNYKPNLNAKGLKERRSFSIVFLTLQMDEYYVSILNAMQEFANQKGYSILILNSNYDKEQEKKHIQHILEIQCDGLIIATGLLNQEYTERLGEIFGDIPVVMLEDSNDTQLPTAFVDVKKLCYQAVEHLIGLGHKKIAYVSAPLLFPTLTHRLEGYKEALTDHGIAVDDSLIFFEKGLEKTDFQRCYEVMQSILRKREFTAMLVISDWAAAVSLRIINEMGLSVPEDLSIIGFDNMAFTEYLKPQISTISQNSKELGRKGIAMLLDRIEGKEPNNIYLEGQLILRQSTGICKKEDK